jgi:uncharacterized protein YjgD (DUF1641 family)
MAKLIDFRQITPKDSREDLARRMEDVRKEHPEDIIAGWDLLRGRHEKDFLDVLSGQFGVNDEVIHDLVGILNSKEAMAALRGMRMLFNALVSIDPDRLHDALAAGANEPPSLTAIRRQLMSQDARRALAMLAGALNVVGQVLHKEPNASH